MNVALAPEPRAYVDEEAFRAEATLWQRAWVCVGTREMLDGPNAFLTAPVGDEDVVVQRFDSGLAAFQNKCLHRHSRVQTERCGHRELVCPFHGWRYGSNGAPTAAPFADPGLVARARTDATLRLSPYRVEVRGAFVFVCRDPAAPSLAEYLGDAGPQLDALAPLVTQPFERVLSTWRVNWKVGVESVLETMHLPFAHGEAPFGQNLDGKRTERKMFGPHSLESTRLTADGVKWWARARERFKLEVPSGVDPDTYTHLTVFPHLQLGITGGSLVATQLYWPAGVDSTRIECALWFGADAGRSTGELDVMRGMRKVMSEGNARILGEDQAIAEGVQRNLARAQHPALLTGAEERIQNFHRALADAQRAAPRSPPSR